MNAETRIDKGAKIVTVHEAKTHLSRLLVEVEAGAEIVVARGRTPVARIVAIEPLRPQRRIPGLLAHERPPGSKGILDAGFWEPLSDEEIGLGHDPLTDRKR